MFLENHLCFPLVTKLVFIQIQEIDRLIEFRRSTFFYHPNKRRVYKLHVLFVKHFTLFECKLKYVPLLISSTKSLKQVLSILYSAKIAMGISNVDFKKIFL